jgi:hypothetical protein
MADIASEHHTGAGTDGVTARSVEPVQATLAHRRHVPEGIEEDGGRSAGQANEDCP